VTDQSALCGNDPRAQLGPGDQAAVDEFAAYLAARRATERYEATNGPTRPEADPPCAHCGEPITGHTIREWTGPAGTPARAWHGDRDACRAAGLPEETEASGDDGQLRDQYAEALHAAGGPFTNTDPETLADAVLAVRDRHLDNADARLALCRTALLRDGYFTAEEIGPDIAPRITELASHLRQRAEQAEAAIARVRTLGDIWFREGAPGPTREAGRRIIAALDHPTPATCTARLGPVPCTRPAGHYQPTRHPGDGDDIGGWHAGPPGPRDHRTLWTDDDGAARRVVW
jgi:hypothetical protein